MRMVNVSEDEDVIDFAKMAAMAFAKHKGVYTYTNGGIEAGELFAVRFGGGDNCVVVFRLDENFEPINYQQLVDRYVGE